MWSCPDLSRPVQEDKSLLNGSLFHTIDVVFLFFDHTHTLWMGPFLYGLHFLFVFVVCGSSCICIRKVLGLRSSSIQAHNLGRDAISYICSGTFNDDHRSSSSSRMASSCTWIGRCRCNDGGSHSMVLAGRVGQCWCCIEQDAVRAMQMQTMPLVTNRVVYIDLLCIIGMR